MPWKAVLFIACAGLVFATGHMVAANEVQHVMGTVVQQSTQQLQIRTPEGRLVAVDLDQDTRYEREGRTSTRGDIDQGIRVVVEAENVAGKLEARLVQIGVITPPGSGQGQEEHQHSPHEMPHPTPAMGMFNFPHAREGSGTAWLPDSTPMHAVHRQAGPWQVMLHGNVFVGYDHQGSDRGDEQFLSTNWLMLMARRHVAGGEFGARAMLSLEPLTVGKEGYPLLLQTGESLEGVPLHDRQHPHDLFMEAALTYARPITKSVGLQLYAAPAGEPALGPVAFPHRISAASDPLAPLSHHWQDSSHITFGVLTAGLFTRRVKLEGSWFNGREPDEDRYDFDLRQFDSFSGRLALNPSASLSLQASYGFLESPEGLEPETSLRRLTLSATHHLPLRGKGFLATTGVWGRNDESGEPPTDAFLFEGNLDLDGRNMIFGRLEFVEKTGADLVLPPAQELETFDISSAVLGYLREFDRVGSFSPGVGIRGSINFIRDDLRPSYGTNNPAGVMVFLRVRAAPMQMEPESREPVHH